MKRQAMIALAGFVGMILIAKMDYHWYARFAVLAYIMSYVLMIAVSLFGRKVNGRRRWLAIGPISFQPTAVSYTHLAGTDISCVSLYGHGPLTIEQSLMKSCNAVMMQLVQDVYKRQW